jgi:hypothetical protein
MFRRASGEGKRNVSQFACGFRPSRRSFRVLEGFCRDKGIPIDSPDREMVASALWMLFENGARTPEQFEAELARFQWCREG